MSGMRGASVILESTMLNVKLERESDFEAAFNEAKVIISSMPGLWALSYCAVSKLGADICSLFDGILLNTIRWASGLPPKTSGGKRCVTTSTILFPPLSTTSEWMPYNSSFARHGRYAA